MVEITQDAEHLRENVRVLLPLHGPGHEEIRRLLLVGVPAARPRQLVEGEHAEDEVAVLRVRAAAVRRDGRPGLLAAAFAEYPLGGPAVDMLPVARCHGPGHQLLHGRQDAEGPLQVRQDRPVSGADRDVAERQLRHVVVLVVLHTARAHRAGPARPGPEHGFRAPLVPVPGQGEQVRPPGLRQTQPGLPTQDGRHHRGRAAVDGPYQWGRSVREPVVRVRAALDQSARDGGVVRGDRQAQHRQAVVRAGVRVLPRRQQGGHLLRVPAHNRRHQIPRAHAPPPPPRNAPRGRTPLREGSQPAGGRRGRDGGRGTRRTPGGAILVLAVASPGGLGR